MCGWKVSLRFFLFRVFLITLLNMMSSGEKKINSSKIDMPIWHIMLAFIEENM